MFFKLSNPDAKNNISVDLSERNLADDGLVVQLKKYQDNTVSYLNLAINNLTSLSGETLKEFILRQKNSLEILRLIRNKLGAEGIKTLASVINESNLKVLRLNDNVIGETGIVKLCKKLEKNNCLKKLDISYNKLTEKAFSSIINMLKVNRALEYLILQRCRLSEHCEQLMDLLAVAKENQTLKGIEIMPNNLPPGIYPQFTALFYPRCFGIMNSSKETKNKCITI